MNWINLVVGIGLGVLWVVGLTDPSVATAWYSWLIFGAAVLLILNAVGSIGPHDMNHNA